MDNPTSTILPIHGVGMFKPEQSEAIFFDIKKADGIVRMYLAIRSDGALTLKESDIGE